MSPYLENFGANPSAIHRAGRLAREAIETARLELARTLGVTSSAICFTGSGTESNNLAIVGYVEYLHHQKGVPYSEMEIVTTPLEHPSVLSLTASLESKGVKVVLLPVTADGQVTTVGLKAVLNEKTRLVTLAYVNSEIGTIQPVANLVRVVRSYSKTAQSGDIMFHVDAAQAPLWVSCNLPSLGVDLMTLDAGKCGGPFGVGVLAGRALSKLKPIIYGGGQEQGLRPGTEATAAIVGASKALVLAQESFVARSEMVSQVRDWGIRLLTDYLPSAVLNGAVNESRIANNINFSLPGFDTEYAIVFLDSRGIAASTKSACAGAGSGRSAVVWAISQDDARARATIRLTLNTEITKEDIEKTLKTLQEFVKLNSLTK